MADGFLPVGHTCFFSIDLPRYSTLKVRDIYENGSPCNLPSSLACSVCFLTAICASVRDRGGGWCGWLVDGTRHLPVPMNTLQSMSDRTPFTLHPLPARPECMHTDLSPFTPYWLNKLVWARSACVGSREVAILPVAPPPFVTGAAGQAFVRHYQLSGHRCGQQHGSAQTGRQHRYTVRVMAAWIWCAHSTLFWSSVCFAVFCVFGNPDPPLSLRCLASHRHTGRRCTLHTALLYSNARAEQDATHTSGTGTRNAQRQKKRWPEMSDQKSWRLGMSGSEQGAPDRGSASAGKSLKRGREPHDADAEVGAGACVGDGREHGGGGSGAGGSGGSCSAVDGGGEAVLPHHKRRAPDGPSHDPVPFECPCDAAEYNCQKRAPVRSACACKRLLCRKCAGVVASLPHAATCDLCGAPDQGPFELGDFPRDVGVLATLVDKAYAAAKLTM